MDIDDSDVGSSPEETMDIRHQTSCNMNLNVMQNGHSPTLAHVSVVQRSLSSTDEAILNGVLKIGMEFESDEHAYRFYNKYAGLVGFSVRKDWVNRSKIHGQVVSRKFTCSREGYRRRDKRDGNVKKHRKETRTGCLAHMIITRQPDGKYRVTHFEAMHNHEYGNPSNAHKFQELTSPSMICSPGVSEVEFANNLERQSKLAFQMLGRRFGAGMEPDCFAPLGHADHLKSGRTRDMKEGEAARLLSYFQKQHFENPSFFYAVQVDVDDRISNIFWADDNMLVDYDHFGDVVCLDTTYRTSKDHQPLVQFIGLNHHKQVLIFAAALLYDESVDSLKWLFRTFLEAMSGKKPKTILTNQDATIIEAINSVLPETNHCVCVWQMYHNTLKHLSHLIKDVDSFAEDFKSCIFDHEDEEEFTHAWDAVIEKYSLQQNEWLRWMLREKEKWAVVYGKNTFFKDLKREHNGEILSCNLSSSLNCSLDLLRFFKHFESVVNDQRCRELEASYDMGKCTPRLMGNVVLLKHASKFYTPKAFEVFQREYEKCLNVVVKPSGENGSVLEYKSNTFGRRREYIVTVNSLDGTVVCSCMKFEYVGFLCCHVLKVLDYRNIKVVPDCYILKRWTKDARVESARDDRTVTAEINPKLIIASRYKDVSHRILKIAARASESDRAFKFAVRQLDEVMHGVESILRLKPSDESQAISSSSTGVNASEGDQSEVFLDRNVIEGQDENNVTKGGNNIKGIVPGKDLMNNINGKISRTKHAETLLLPPADNVTTTLCPPLAYVSSPSSTLNPVTQDLYNFEGNQVVHCVYQPLASVIDQPPDPDIYQTPPTFYSHQHDSPSQDQLLQGSVARASFQNSMSNNTELSQAINFDVQHPHSSCLHDPRFRESSTQYFGSK